MKVTLAGAARRDLNDIFDWIAADSPAAAVRVVRALVAASIELGDHPRAFTVIPRCSGLSIRRKPWRDYLIFYRIEHESVAVLRILHGARDLNDLEF